MAFKIIFYILPLVLISCSQLSKESCQKSSVEAKAKKDGSEGTANRYSRLKKKCGVSPDLESSYNRAYTNGLNNFCSYSRGEEQAELGLEKETTCLVSSKYEEGYLKKLESICDVQKARVDARKLLNSDNRICLLIPKYKNSYIYHLKKQCSYKKGFSIGLLKKGIDHNCKDSPSFPRFKKGHSAGLSEGYRIENQDLQKSVVKLQTDRKPLQLKLAQSTEPETVQKNKIKLNVLESKILELEHQIEKNKRFID
jgi:hypothetical protein